MSAGTELCPPKVLKTALLPDRDCVLKMSPAGEFHSQAVTCGTQVRGEDLAFTASSNGRSLVDRRITRHTASQSSAVPVCPG